MMERAQETGADARPDIGFDHSSAAVMGDPYPLYRRMQAECPVNWSSAYGGFWVAGSYAAVVDVAMNHKIFSSTDGAGIPRGAYVPLFPIHLDPPRQTGFRKILNPRFSADAVERWRAPFAAEMHRLIDGFEARGRVELASELFLEAPLAAVLPLIGVPRTQIRELREWIAASLRGRADMDKARAAQLQIRDYLLALIAERRAAPKGDDVLGDLIDAELAGAPLSDDDIYRTLTIILFGGLDTTTAAMLEGARHLAAHPEDVARLAADPALWPDAVEEFVRFTSPTQGAARTLLADTEEGGFAMRKGEKIMMLLAAANHDPAKYPDPDRVEIDRCPVDHVAFGRGAHLCLGRNLARLEITEGLRILFSRLPDIRIDSDARLEYWVNETRSLIALPAHFAPRTPAATARSHPTDGDQ